MGKASSRSSSRSRHCLNRTGFAIFPGQTERPQAQREIPRFRGQPVPILGPPPPQTSVPPWFPALGFSPPASTLRGPGQASGDGDTHLCSRSPRLCLPGWWTPGFCHTWRSGSRTCARTAGQEQSPVRQGSNALADKQALTHSGWQRGVSGMEALLWKEPCSQPGGQIQRATIRCGHCPHGGLVPQSFHPHSQKSFVQ